MLADVFQFFRNGGERMCEGEEWGPGSNSKPFSYGGIHSTMSQQRGTSCVFFFIPLPAPSATLGLIFFSSVIKRFCECFSGAFCEEKSPVAPSCTWFYVCLYAAHLKYTSCPHHNNDIFWYGVNSADEAAGKAAGQGGGHKQQTSREKLTPPRLLYK